MTKAVSAVREPGRPTRIDYRYAGLVGMETWRLMSFCLEGYMVQSFAAAAINLVMAALVLSPGFRPCWRRLPRPDRILQEFELAKSPNRDEFDTRIAADRFIRGRVL